MLNDRQLSKLIRTLRSESGDHPLMAEAIRAKATILAGLDWADNGQVLRASEKLAVEIDDWVSYHGQPLDDYIREPWLSRWGQTCIRAVTNL